MVPKEREKMTLDEDIYIEQSTSWRRSRVFHPVLSESLPNSNKRFDHGKKGRRSKKENVVRGVFIPEESSSIFTAPVHDSAYPQ